jgi:hypothetical protein
VVTSVTATQKCAFRPSGDALVAEALRQLAAEQLLAQVARDPRALTAAVAAQLRPQISREVLREGQRFLGGRR